MFLLDEPSRVPGDHQIFVCRHDANRHRGAVAGDDPRVRRVAIEIEPDAEELEALADALPDGCRVLADAARENEGVEPAKSSGQSPQKLLRLVTEESDRLGGAPVGRLAVQQVPHVRARPGDAEEASPLVQEIAHLGWGHAPLLQQKERHARVEVAAPRAHHEPAGRGKAHGRVDADAAPDGGYARTVAEMRDDEAPVVRLAVYPAQLAHDVLVGEPVEAVTDDALLREPSR